MHPSDLEPQFGIFGSALAGLGRSSAPVIISTAGHTQFFAEILHVVFAA
jgi:hypothetical protein